MDNNKTFIPPSAQERASWKQATKDYVELLETDNEYVWYLHKQLQQENERLKVALLAITNVSCADFHLNYTVAHNIAKQALKGGK